MFESIINKCNIDYGFVDKYGIRHTKIKKNYYLENYRVQTIEDTIKYNIGTCFEYVELIRYYLKNEGIDIDSYILLYNDPKYIARHTIGVLNKDNKFYLLENKVLEFNSLNDIFKYYIDKYPSMYKINDFDKNKIEIYNYDKAISGLSYYEFEKYIKKSKRIICN